jgi:hypothetical protein
MMKLRGLYTFPNDMSAVPEGALSVADNIVIDKDSIAEPRRGLTFASLSDLTRADFATGEMLERIFFYKNGILSLVHNNTGPYDHLKYFSPATSGWRDNDGPLGELWDVALFSDIKPQSLQERGNLYITTAEGLIKLDALNAYPEYAGLPVARDIKAASPLLVSTSSPYWLAVNYAVYYKTTIVRTDANGNEYESAPSSPFYLKNDTSDPASPYYNPGNPSGYPVSTNIAVFYPSFVKVGDKIRVYRSASSLSPNIGELQLCFEETIDIPTGDTQVLDVCIDEMLGTALYTSNSREGSESSNFPPPLAKDIALFRDCVFLSNFTETPDLYLTLKSTAAAGSANVNNFRAGDTLTIAGVVFTGVVGVPTGAQFTVITGGTTEYNTAQTMQSLSAMINQYFATSTSGLQSSYVVNIQEDLIGRIRIWRKSFEASTLQFTVNSNRPKAFIPNMVGGALSSSYNVVPNGLACSKPSIPDAFPLNNQWFVGSRDEAIYRILTLRDSLFILKEDGVWRLWGTDPSNFQIALLDGTVKCIAPDGALVLNNQIFALTTQGVVSITENGVTIVSRPIERNLLDLLATDAADMFLNAFAVGYESERSYTLFLPTVAADVYPTQYYRYNVITNNWTRGTLAKACGGVNPYDDRMYLGDRTHKWMDVERKSFTSFDYADYVNTLSITSSSGSTVVFNAGTSDLVAGRVLYQLDTRWCEIASVSNVGAVYTVTLKYPITFLTGAVQILDPIDCKIKWTPNAFQNPGINKHYREATLIFLSDFYGQGTVSFETDQYPQILYETIEGSMASPWGLFPWGIAPWGGNSPRRRPVRIAVPRNHKRASWLKVGFEHDVCFSPWKIQGISVIGTNISEKVGTDT